MLYDLIIIGLGSGGILAAEFAARELDLRVAAIERGRIGGDCLWTGCVPSKALLASAKVAHTARTAAEFGVDTGPVSVDLAQVWDRIKAVQQQIAVTDDSPERIQSWGVDLHLGVAAVTGPRQVSVTAADGSTTVLDSRYILICTGSRPAIADLAGLDQVDYLTSENLFAIDQPPASMVIVGGGAVGVEMAQGLARLGVETTLLQHHDRILPADEAVLTERLAAVLRRDGVNLVTQTAATAVRRNGDGVTLVADDQQFDAQALLIATGRAANVESLGLEKLGLAVGRQGIPVDDRSRTGVPTIYAVGDVAAGRPRFTHAAAYDAVLAVRDMFFPGSGRVAQLVPRATFTDPQLAHVGLTHAAAVARHGNNVKSFRYELADDDRARADGATDGAIIVVCHRGRIVGAQALAPAAGELIHELALAIDSNTGLDEIARLVHIYPTYATGIGRLAGERSYATGRRYRWMAKVGRWLRFTRH